jgi:predicted DNA-binding transcriptional regulator AlpA
MGIHMTATFARQMIDEPAVAKIIGSSRRHVANLEKHALMPAPIYLGRLKRWDASVIERWIAAGCPSRDEFEAMEQAEKS